jgi:hypothetical protein
MKDEEVGGRERLLGVLLAHCDAEEDGDRPTADVDLGISLRGERRETTGLLLATEPFLFLFFSSLR